MIGIIFLGVYSYTRMPKLEDPTVPVKQVNVVAMYPGADVNTVELDVAIPLEDAMRTLPNVERIRTDVNPGCAIISIEFDIEVPRSELEQHFDIVRRKASDTYMRLPQGCMEPIVIDDMMDVYGLLYAFKGDGYTIKELEKYAKKLRRELITIKGVKRVNIGGAQSEVINIEFTPEYIKTNGTMPTQLMMALQSATGALKTGNVTAGTRSMSIEVTQGIESVDDVANLLINTPDGKKVRLGDVAKVTRQYANPHRNAIYVDNNEALTIAITLEHDAIVPDVGKAVDAKIAAVTKDFPVGMETEKIFFQPDKVDEAMGGFMLNLLESVLIVVLVLMFSMGWRSGMIIGFGLILTVALSFPLLSALDTTLQRISLGAFIVAMGMLVDNAVVIMDGILVDRDRGLPQEQYLYRIGRNTAWPLLGATIIAISTFIPIYLTPGSVGEFAGDLFTVICVSLMVSWVLALIQVPMCAKAWLGKPKKQIAPKSDDTLPKGKINNFIHTILHWILSHRKISFACALTLLFAAAIGAFQLRIIFFPDFNYNQFVVECYFPTTNDANQVNTRIRQLADTVSEMAHVDRVIISTSGAPARYCFMRPMPAGGDRYAELIIDCKDFKTVQSVANNVRTKLRAIAPDAYIRARKYNFSIISSHAVEVEFTGPDPQVLRQLAAQAEEVMRQCKYIDPYSVQNNWNARTPQLQYAFSQADAQRAGITRNDVGNALQAATDGYTIGAIYDGDNILPINITMRQADGSCPSPLSSIPVWSTINAHIDSKQLPGLITGTTKPDDITGKMFTTTLLGNVVDSASIKYTDDYRYRYNGQRAIQAEADPDPLNPDATPAKIVADITDAIKAIPLPAGYTMRFAGEDEMSNRAYELVFGFIPMILMIVFIVLLLLFNNWRKLILILACFPFVICGIVPLLLITDSSFTFIAILGFMGLIGMMVKNAIVLVDEINRLQTQEGVAPYDAIIRASLSRVRPVMLASLTTILGMIPILTDAMYGSMAITVLGGLFVGTIITLLLLPLFYSLLFKIKIK